MRVLHVINTFGYGGGAERHLLALVQEQRRMGLDVAVAYLKPTIDELRYKQELHGAGVDVHRLSDRRRLPLGAARRLAALARRTQPDVVHSHLPRADIAVALARRMPAWPGTVTISSVHNNEEFFRQVGYRQLLTWSYRSHARVITISDAVREAVVKQLGVPQDRLDVVPYGIASTETPVSPSRADLGVHPTAQLVGTLARVTRQKGIDVLLHAMQQLPVDVHCLVIGPDEPDAPALHTMVRELGLSGRVTFAGFRQDSLACLGVMDVFCLPSRWEGFGLAVLEAGLASLPVVVSDIAPLNQIVRNGETGWCVALERPGELAAALSTALTDRVEARRRADAHRSRVLTSFSVRAMAVSTERVYSVALKEAG